MTDAIINLIESKAIQFDTLTNDKGRTVLKVKTIPHPDGRLNRAGTGVMEVKLYSCNGAEYPSAEVKTYKHLIGYDNGTPVYETYRFLTPNIDSEAALTVDEYALLKEAIATFQARTALAAVQHACDKLENVARLKLSDELRRTINNFTRTKVDAACDTIMKKAKSASVLPI